jgi:RHS repeat-associated protein
MAGDTIMPGVQCYYASNSLTATNSSFTSVLNSLAGGILGTPTGAAEGTLSGYEASGSPVYSGLSSFLSPKDPAPPSGYPKAYLNWILLDDQFNYVSGSSGSVATASTTYPAGQMNTVAPGGPIVMGRNGYLYVWVSNETQGWDVFFDNFTVQYKQGPVLEENHYYPFGLTMAGISDKALKTGYAENKYRYNKGSELQNKEFSDGSGLEMYETSLRELDPQLGRWWQIDSKPGDMVSGYSSMDNNPILYSDMRGDIVTTDDGSQERYKKLKEQNQKDILNFFTAIINGVMSGKTGTKAFDRSVTLLNKEFEFRDALETIEKSDITYHISSASPGVDPRLAGKTTYNEKTGQIDLTIGNKGIDVLAHEIYHAYQFEIGDVAFGQGNILMDISDERRAEEIGDIFAGPGYQDFVVAGYVTDDYMRKKGYSDMQSTPLNLNSKGSEIAQATGDRFYNYYPDQTAREIFQKRNELAVKSGGQILFIYNDVLRIKK